MECPFNCVWNFRIFEGKWQCGWYKHQLKVEPDAFYPTKSLHCIKYREDNPNPEPRYGYECLKDCEYHRADPEDWAGSPQIVNKCVRFEMNLDISERGLPIRCIKCKAANYEPKDHR